MLLSFEVLPVEMSITASTSLSIFEKTLTTSLPELLTALNTATSNVNRKLLFIFSIALKIFGLNSKEERQTASRIFQVMARKRLGFLISTFC